MNTSDPLIVAEGVTKSFGKDAIISNVSVNIEPRNIVTVIGPNGSGKTTLLKLLLGLETPDAGAVRRKPGLTIGYVPQKLAIDPILPLTVEWFLRLSARGRDMKPLASEVGIAPLLEQRLQSVSGGEMQRILLARALLCEPELLVLDEPAQGVDVGGQAVLYDLIARVSRRHRCAVLMVSHDLHLVMSSTDHVICLNRHVCCSGHPHSVRGDPAFVELFGDHVAQSLAVYTHHHDHEH
ncbi:MAG: ATP-binding cassette domain-containing protein [Pseudomonadota bacterium]|nr:ATP-binding cassette domain-containing protein [Pseudomonadota bacterium]MDE3038257.1 ATP-binding cassette domain-containing protein [Pseudomonadota bacterium]